MDMEIGDGCENTLEISQLDRSMSPPEFEQDVRLPTTPSGEPNNPEPEFLPPPPVDKILQEDPPSPPLVPITNAPSTYDFPDDHQENPSSDPDRDLPPPDSGLDDDRVLSKAFDEERAAFAKTHKRSSSSSDENSP